MNSPVNVTSLFQRFVAVVEPAVDVAAVAERLVAGLATAAQGDPVTGLVLLPVGGLQRDAALEPDAPADVLVGVLDQADRRVEVRLDGDSLSPCPRSPACPDGHCPAIFSARALVFSSFWLEAICQMPRPWWQNRARAQRLCTSSRAMSLPPMVFGIVEIFLPAGRLGAVEGYFHVRPVAEGLML